MQQSRCFTCSEKTVRMTSSSYWCVCGYYFPSVLSVVELCEVPTGPSLQPVVVPLNDSTIFHFINPLLSFVSSANFASQFISLMKLLNGIGPSVNLWGTPVVTGLQLGLEL